MRIKICCISSLEEAKLAINSGADALGLVGAMPSGPGIITDALAAHIRQQVPPPISTFLLSSETTAEALIAHHQRVGSDTLQLVDALPTEAYARLQQQLPFVRLVQVVHVVSEASLEVALQAATRGIHAILLDSGNPALAVKELGGTGRVHNWQISRKIVAQCPLPVFLAGGLKPENVRQAMEAVQPFGLDLCSGVRSGGRLDPRKLEAFIKAVRG